LEGERIKGCFVKRAGGQDREVEKNRRSSGGKRANKIEDQPLFVTDAQVFKDKKSICKKILSIRQCDAEKAGVDRKTF